MKVISFSIWGSDAHFYDGAMANAELAQKYYPGWMPVFYVREDAPDGLRDRLVSTGAPVFMVPQTKGEWEGLFWRFRPIYDDPDVTHVLSRDCDSRLNPREAAAVNEWLASGELFHSMRDHVEHQVPIMGGMFGCRHWVRFGELLNEWTDYSCKGIDQRFLQERVWPEVQLRSVTHDKYPQGMAMPIDVKPWVYEYKPIDFWGRHDIRPFPDHEPLDTAIHGEHVGARVGVPA